MGRLVQQLSLARTDRKYPARRGRSAFLCPSLRAGHSGVTQTKQPPANPVRFILETMASTTEGPFADPQQLARFDLTEFACFITIQHTAEADHSRTLQGSVRRIQPLQKRTHAPDRSCAT